MLGIKNGITNFVKPSHFKLLPLIKGCEKNKESEPTQTHLSMLMPAATAYHKQVKNMEIISSN